MLSLAASNKKKGRTAYSLAKGLFSKPLNKNALFYSGGWLSLYVLQCIAAVKEMEFLLNSICIRNTEMLNNF